MLRHLRLLVGQTNRSWTYALDHLDTMLNWCGLVQHDPTIKPPVKRSTVLQIWPLETRQMPAFTLGLDDQGLPANRTDFAVIEYPNVGTGLLSGIDADRGVVRIDARLVQQTPGSLAGYEPTTIHDAAMRGHA